MTAASELRRLKARLASGGVTRRYLHTRLAAAVRRQSSTLKSLLVRKPSVLLLCEELVESAERAISESLMAFEQGSWREAIARFAEAEQKLAQIDDASRALATWSHGYDRYELLRAAVQSTLFDDLPTLRSCQLLLDTSREDLVSGQFLRSSKVSSWVAADLDFLLRRGKRQRCPRADADSGLSGDVRQALQTISASGYEQLAARLAEEASIEAGLLNRHVFIEKCGKCANAITEAVGECDKCLQELLDVTTPG